ncbi:MAG: hypothetical protein SGPRY_008754, partial [Prymnesium sp.]
ALLASPPGVEALRDAEKSRKPTCAFADRLANCALESFHKVRVQAGFDYKQTVLAAIVVLRSSPPPPAIRLASPSTPPPPSPLPPEGVASPPAMTPEMYVASLACGTKFLRREKVEADRVGGCVRDCHAEVLARRCFRRYLAAEIRRVLRGEASNAAHPPILEEGPPGCRMRLAAGVSLHLYSSSQPCGNASIKRWAKPTAGPSLVPCGEYGWPQSRHERLDFCADELYGTRHPAMLCTSVKLDTS